MAEEQGGGGATSRDLVSENFGFLIAYLLPGVLVLWAAFYASDGLRQWIKDAAAASSSVGSFLILVLAALLAGMMLQSVRWWFFEQWLPGRRWALQRWPQLERPDYDEARSAQPAIQARLTEYRDQHYRYYQHHGAVAMALPALWASWWLFQSPETRDAIAWAGVVLVLCAISFLAALDALRRMRSKTGKLLGSRKEVSA